MAERVHSWLGIRVSLAAAVRTGAALCWVYVAVLPAEYVSLPPIAGGRHWEIRVTQEGLYRIGCEQLAGIFGAAMPDLAYLQVARGSAGTEPAGEVALREVDADGDRRCDAGDDDAIEFWGEPGRGRYDAGGYYWLSMGEMPGRRMARRPSAAGGLPDPLLGRTQLFEQNRYYRSSVGGRDPTGTLHDHWFWTFLAFGSSAFAPAQDFVFTMGPLAVGPVAGMIAGIDAGAGTAPVASALVSVTLASLAGSHRVQAAINGVVLGDLLWQGSDVYEGGLVVPPGVLQGGENRLTLTLIPVQAPVAPVLVDRFAVTYRLPQPFDLDGENTPADRPLIFRTEPGSWQLQFSSAAAPITLLDITDPLRPVEVASTCTGGSCLLGIAGTEQGTFAAMVDGARMAVDSFTEDVPSQWRAPSNGADYILIAHRILWAAAQRLADHRRDQGMRVALIDVEDIYDEFNGGQVDAEAIRTFIAYARSNWQPPAPTYVLLLGDGTFDPRGYCASPGTCPELVTAPGSTLIPPYLAPVDPWLGETAADNRFVALDPNSSLPTLAVGRLPANDLVEAQTMVDKILAYEDSLPTATAAHRVAVALVSDNAYSAGGALDPAGNFWQLSDAAFVAAQQAAAGNGMQLTAQHFYLNVCDGIRYPHCLLSDPPFSRYAEADTLKTALAAWLNTGAQPAEIGLLLHYVGHGAITGWAGQPVLLQNRDVAELGLVPRLPVVLDMSCYTGYFHFPGLQSMAEAWLSSPQHGAVAVVASSGLDLAEAHAVFDAALLSEFAGHAPTTIGRAFLSAKLAATAGLPQAVDTYHLFGDPAMPLWVAGPASGSSPNPTSTAALPTTQTPATTPATTPVPSLTTPLAPPISPTPVPDLPPDAGSFLYLPWVSLARAR